MGQESHHFTRAPESEQHASCQPAILYRQVGVPEDCHGKRLDAVLAEILPDFSREKLKKWIKSGECLVNGQRKRPRDLVEGGEKISIHAALSSIENWVPNPDLPQANIVYEDEDLIIVNKPADLVVHPAAGHAEDTLVNQLLCKYSELKKLPRSGIIHRLDKDTTGLLIVVRSLRAHTRLVEALQQRRITRVYQALCFGELPMHGTIDAPIGRDPFHRKRMAIVPNTGKQAVTHYKVIQQFPGLVLLEVTLETGRTHQIRVHLSKEGAALVGDPVYGTKGVLSKWYDTSIIKAIHGFHRQALHACRLSFVHPTQKKQMVFDAPLPEDFQKLLACLHK